MTSIIKQENGELFLYRSEKEFPQFHIWKESFEQDKLNWFSTAERIKVAEWEKERFHEDVTTYMDLPLDRSFEQQLADGVSIPESCYEVRPECRYDIDGPNVAYFKDDRATEKETETVSYAEFFRKLSSVPNYSARNLRVEFTDGHISIGEITTTTAEGKSPDRPQEPSLQEERKQHAIEFQMWVLENYFLTGGMYEERKCPYGKSPRLFIGDVYEKFLSRK